MGVQALLDTATAPSHVACEQSELELHDVINYLRYIYVDR